MKLLPRIARALLAASLLLSSSLVAGALDDAKSALERSDYPTALRLLRDMAQQGNAEAQYEIGAMYWNGRGVTKDYGEAVRWIRQSAEQGFPPAAYDLSISYRDGLGNPKDDAEAFRWNREAAEHGFAPAQHNLASRFMAGRGVPRDEGQAAQWFRKAADQGWTSSLGALGIMYAQGRGVPRDEVEAYKWLTLAAEGMQGPEREKIIEARNQLTRGITAPQIEQAKQRVSAWTPMGSNKHAGYIRQRQWREIAGGQPVDMGSYVVAAPVGNDWKVEALADLHRVAFMRGGKTVGDVATVGVEQRTLDPETNALGDDEIVAKIQFAEEAGFRERHPPETFTFEQTSKDTTNVGARKLYRKTYAITDRDAGTPIRTTQVLYVYLPEDRKASRRAYLFLVEQPQRVGDQAPSPDTIAVEPIIDSLREQ